MTILRNQRRLAASILRVGQNRVWIDPTEGNEVSLANSRLSVRKLIKNGVIRKRKVVVHSRFQARAHLEAKRKGRHCGYGKRKGTREARLPTKVIWMRRQRVLRRLLKKYRAARKIDHRIYHKFYMAAKGNQFKNKTVLIEAIHRSKAEKIKAEKLQVEQDARRARNQEVRKRKLDKKKAAAVA
jgi:large subunit ribosomal protein L19e